MILSPDTQYAAGCWRGASHEARTTIRGVRIEREPRESPTLIENLRFSIEVEDERGRTVGLLGRLAGRDCWLASGKRPTS